MAAHCTAVLWWSYLAGRAHRTSGAAVDSEVNMLGVLLTPYCDSSPEFHNFKVTELNYFFSFFADPKSPTHAQQMC